MSLKSLSNTDTISSETETDEESYIKEILELRKLQERLREEIRRLREKEETETTNKTSTEETEPKADNVKTHTKWIPLNDLIQ